MQINLSSPGAIAAQVTSFLKPWVMCGGTEQMYLAALMIWAGR